MSRRSTARRLVRLGANGLVWRGLALAAVLAVLLGAAWLWLRVVRPAWQGVEELRAAQAIAQRLAPPGGDLAALLTRRPRQEELAALEARLASAHGAWSEAADGLAALSPALGLARVVPVVGPGLAAAPDAATLAAALSGAGADLLGAARPTLAALDGGPLTERLGPAVAALRAASPRLQRGARAVSTAGAAFARLQDVPLDGPLAPLGPWRAELARRLPVLQRAVHLVAALPGPLGEALGLDGPRSYMILGQSEEERRASGGYVGSMGLLRLEGGRIVAVEFRDSRDWSNRAVEPVPAPVPLAEYMGHGAWYVRDANWFAEFPTSAAWIEWFLTRDWGLRLNGVIAVDQEVVRSLLRIVGPVDLPAYGELITADNLRERTTYWLYAAPFGGRERLFASGVKSPFVADLGQALLGRLLAVESGESPQLLAAVQRLLAEKHLLVTVKQPVLADLLREQGWDGRLPRAAGDTVYVLEHTASFTKISPYITVTRDYTVTIDARGAPVEARLALRYENRYDAAAARALYPLYYLSAYWDVAQRREAQVEGYYAALLRVYVPRGSALLGADGWAALLDADEEADHTVLGGLLALPAGATRTVTLTWRPGPTASPPGTYRLALPKQPGSDAQTYRVTVRLPASATVAAIDPPAAVDGGAATWQGALRTDRRLTLVLGAP
ncbi:MAG: DUF4012 domain-containing protein [Chloroflexi bacterium]|nr:DUF4012 domain-containing protein [Chloroflexota bacterium]